ncbi:MAG: type II toxin-antitoxin system HicB family antitoxin [Lachnospiraceae bacterium]|nr:type II toxin-antitoxin system HicB family antitoxin [Lachnospiraceae bacterium]
MSKYAYPAIFHQEENGFYIDFPDIETCFTQGRDIPEGMEMARDALALILCEFEDHKRRLPVPSDLKEIKTGKDAFATLICCDTDHYRMTLNSRAVKKTLTIPAWMNDAAIAAGINFSQVLQEALLLKLGRA